MTHSGRVYVRILWWLRNPTWAIQEEFTWECYDDSIVQQDSFRKSLRDNSIVQHGIFGRSSRANATAISSSEMSHSGGVHVRMICWVHSAILAIQSEFMWVHCIQIFYDMGTWCMIYCCIIIRFSLIWILGVWSLVVLYSYFLFHGYFLYDLLLYCIKIFYDMGTFCMIFWFFSIQIFSDLDNLCMIYCCIGLRFSLTCVLCVWFIVVLHSNFLRLWYFMYDLLLYCIEIFSGLGTLFMIYFCFSFRFSSGLGTLYYDLLLFCIQKCLWLGYFMYDLLLYCIQIFVWLDYFIYDLFLFFIQIFVWLGYFVNGN